MEKIAILTAIILAVQLKVFSYITVKRADSCATAGDCTQKRNPQLASLPTNTHIPTQRKAKSERP